MKKDELSDKLYNPNYNIIVDFREFETLLDSTTTESTSDFFDFIKVLDLKCRIAFLTAKPQQVVVSMILKGLTSKFADITIEVFSTVEASLWFLGFPAEKLDPIYNKITELNKKTG